MSDLPDLSACNDKQLCELYHQAHETIDTLEQRLKEDPQYAMAKTVLAEIQIVGMQRLKDSGATSIATPAGTLHIVNRTTTRVEDPPAFTSWAFENDEREAIECKANMTFARDYEEKHGHPPPGVKLVTFPQIRVTAPKAPMKRLSDGK